jgi:hypothetical protein
MRFKNFQIQLGKPKDNPESETPEENDVMVSQIADMEEQVNGKTKELEETEQQLKELASTVEEAEEESQPQPHGPLGELTVEPGDMDDDLDESLFEGDDDGPPVVEVIKAENIAEAATPSVVPEETPQAEPAVADNSLSNLFGDDEEEENPLAALIASMPDVTPQELIDDLHEIHDIMKDWHH